MHVSIFFSLAVIDVDTLRYDVVARRKKKGIVPRERVRV